MEFEEFFVKVKRAESPFCASLKRAALAAKRFKLPFPRVLDPVYLSIHYLRCLIYEAFERLCVALYRFPLLRAQCVYVGERLQMERVPAINGPINIFLGDDVRLSSSSSFTGAPILSDSEVRIGDRTFIGHGCQFSVAKSVVIGDDVLIAGDCAATVVTKDVPPGYICVGNPGRVLSRTVYESKRKAE